MNIRSLFVHSSRAVLTKKRPILDKDVPFVVLDELCLYSLTEREIKPWKN
jgi:hypothetical protein